jgi:hypothetical protein
LKTDTAAFSSNIDTRTGVATAKRDDGKGEVVLERVKGDNPDEEILMKNLRRWNATAPLLLPPLALARSLCE